MNPVGTALAYVLETRRSVFITGKAGSGKTTLVEQMTACCTRSFAVVAPTGVAALRAGGTTIHSLFKIPVGTIIPDRRAATPIGMLNWKMLLDRWRASPELADLLQALDLIFIDEVSMVRPDLLDAVDQVLRQVRQQPKQPFGGVQVVYVGDLLQLAPVYHNAEWQVLKPYYHHPFFHASFAVRSQQPILIQLTQIYRQQDPVFISLLNQVRMGYLDEASWQLLNSRVVDSTTDQRSVERNDQRAPRPFLTTHVQKAQSMNEVSLQKLPGQLHVLTAELSGDFSRGSCPAEEKLMLKPGARIMLLKNDIEKPARFYNGKLGWVEEISQQQLTIRFSEGEPLLMLERETWKQMKYRFNPVSKRLEQVVTGTFKQFPVKLAWAITVHKSQGLSFDEVELDLEHAFAAGQVYVALSRCRSLDGLYLRQAIPKRAIRTDMRLLRMEEDEAFQSPFYEDWRAAFVRQIVRQLSFSDQLYSVWNAWIVLYDVVLDSIPLWKQSPELRIRGIESALVAIRNGIGTTLLQELNVWTINQPEVSNMSGSSGTTLDGSFQRCVQLLRDACSVIDQVELLVSDWDLTAYNRELILHTQDALRKFGKELLVLKEKVAASLSACERISNHAFDCWQVYQSGAGCPAKDHLSDEPNIHPAVESKEIGAVKEDSTLSRELELKSPRLIRSRTEQGADFDPRGLLSSTELSPDLRTQLLAFRSAMAQSQRVPPYRILTNEMLRAIVQERPADRIRLSSIRGMGPKRMERYGDQILELVNRSITVRAICEASVFPP